MIEDMKVGMVDFSEEFREQAEALGSENHIESDFSLLCHYATFIHKEACEFILYTEYEDNWYEEIGFSDALRELVNQAEIDGFKYICFYA